jgi:L-fuconolactonase
MGPTAASGLVDTHHHFWRTPRHHRFWRDAGLDPLARDFGPDDLAVDLARAGVSSTVLIESLDEPEENAELLSYAAEASHVAGVVGWVPLNDPVQAAPMLDDLSRHEVVRGVRHLIRRDPADWLVEPETLALFRELARRDLSWDVVPVTPGHVDHVCRIAEAVPDLRIVADHLARPPLDDGSWEPWATGVSRLAGCPKVALKLSVGVDVLTSWPRWDADLLPRYVAWAYSCFGADRLMLASNWPVILLRRSYTDVLADLERALDGTGVDADALAAIKQGTARRWYRLAEDSSA